MEGRAHIAGLRFERVDRAQWRCVWAALARQHLTADLYAGPLSDQGQAISLLQEVQAEFGYERSVCDAIAALR